MRARETVDRVSNFPHSLHTDNRALVIQMEGRFSFFFSLFSFSYLLVSERARVVSYLCVIDAQFSFSNLDAEILSYSRYNFVVSRGEETLTSFFSDRKTTSIDERCTRAGAHQKHKFSYQQRVRDECCPQIYIYVYIYIYIYIYIYTHTFDNIF